MNTVGLITIGQSPRPDILRSMFPSRDNVPFIEGGAMDMLSRAQIEGLSPVDGEHPLVSRLRDGSEVIVAKERLIPHLKRAVKQTVSENASLLVVLCTGEFPDLGANVPVVYPDRVLTRTVDAVLPSGTIGVMMPHQGQEASMRAKWTAGERQFVGVAVSPYSAEGDLAERARELAAAGADLIMMDCMGFTAEMKRVVTGATGLPTILANRLVGRVIEELVES